MGAAIKALHSDWRDREAFRIASQQIDVQEVYLPRRIEIALQMQPSKDAARALLLAILKKAVAQ